MLKTKITGCDLANAGTVKSLVDLLEAKGTAIHMAPGDADGYENYPVPLSELNDFFAAILVTPYRVYQDPYNDCWVIDQFFDEGADVGID